MKKEIIFFAAIFILVLPVSCAYKPTLEDRLNSKDTATVRAALADVWRTGEANNLAFLVSLLDNNLIMEDAAIALSRLQTTAVDHLILRGGVDTFKTRGELFYLYLVSKKRPLKSVVYLGEWKLEDPVAELLLYMIEIRRDFLPLAWQRALPLLDNLDPYECPAIAREYVMLLGEKGNMDFYISLQKYGEKYPQLKTFTTWAMRKIKPDYKIKYDLVDRTIRENPYWKKQGDGPAMPSKPGTFKAWHTANPDILVENGMIYFYYRGGDGHDRMAVASVPYDSFDGANFVDYPNNPIIDIGKDAFDDLAVLDPAVVYFNKRVFLYYSGLGKGDDSIGLATSKDFYNFKKYKKPVLVGRAPEIVLKDGLLYMYFVKPNEYGGYSIYLATSRDGYNFTQYGNAPVFTYGEGHEWDSKSVTVPRIREKDGYYYMFYAGDDKYMDYPAYFGVAFSYDLVNWYRGTQNPVFSRGKKGEWDDGGIWYAEVFPYKNRLFMYYEGWGGAESHEKEYGQGGHSQIGLAVSDYSLEDML